MKMQFSSLNVREHLKEYGSVFTVRGYDLKDRVVKVDDVGNCTREKIKEIKRITDLTDYVSRSGFLSALTWWLVIGRYTNGKRKFLYRVEKMGRERLWR